MLSGIAKMTLVHTWGMTKMRLPGRRYLQSLKPFCKANVKEALGDFSPYPS